MVSLLRRAGGSTKQGFCWVLWSPLQCWKTEWGRDGHGWGWGWQGETGRHFVLQCRHGHCSQRLRGKLNQTQTQCNQQKDFHIDFSRLWHSFAGSCPVDQTGWTEEILQFCTYWEKKEMGKTQSQESIKKSKLMYFYSNPLGENNSTRPAEQTLDKTTTRL